MTVGLLIITLIIILVLIISPVVITLVISKNEKNKEIFKHIISTSLIIDAVALIVLLSLWITPIKNNNLKFNNSEGSSKTTTNNEEAEEEITDDELSKAGFKELSLSEYLDLIKSSDKQIILVARPTCHYCQQFTPILKQAKEEMNLTVNYINTDNLSTDDWSTFQNSLDYLSSEEWGTPLTLIVQNGKVLDTNNGYVELDSIKTFFSKNGFGE